METRKALTAGKITLFSEGEYSDYGHIGVFVALKDLTIDDLKEMCKPLAGGEDEYYRDQTGGVIPLLIREGYLLEVDVTEVHIGSYGRLDPGIY